MKNRKKTIIILFTLLSIIIFPTISYATILQQLDYSGTATETRYGYQEITNINGIIGTGGTYQTKIYKDNSAGTGMMLKIFCFTNNTYTISCNNSNTDDWISGYYFYSTQTIITDVGENDLSWDFPETLDFEIDKFYEFRVTVGTGDLNTYQMGSPTDTYDGGIVKYFDGTPLTGIADSYFIFTYNNINNLDSTQIYTVTPPDDTTIATSTSATIGATGYVNADDMNDETTLKIHLWRQTQTYNNLSIISGAFQENPEIQDFTWEIATNGSFDLSTTTNMLDENLGWLTGKWTMTTTLSTTNSAFLGFSFGSKIITSTSTSFIVASSTQYDLIMEKMGNALFDLSSENESFSCEINFTGLFSFTNLEQCVKLLFIPNTNLIYQNIKTTTNTILSSFPLGYITDILSKFATPQTGALPILNATLPSALGLGSPSLTLDFTNAIDFVLNADGGDFTDNSQTFSELTLYYWKIVIYVLAVFYILSRIIGTAFMPDFHSWEERGRINISIVKDLQKAKKRDTRRRYNQVVNKIARKSND